MSHYPFRDFACRDAPIPAHFEGQQFFAANHVPYSCGRAVQQFSGLIGSQPRYRVVYAVLLGFVHLACRNEVIDSTFCQTRRSCG